MKVTISEMKKQLIGRKYLQIKKLQEAFIQSMKRTHTTLNGSGKKKRLKQWAEDLNKHFVKEDIQRPTGKGKIAPQLYPSGKHKSNHDGLSLHICRSTITK